MGSSKQIIESSYFNDFAQRRGKIES